MIVTHRLQDSLYEIYPYTAQLDEYTPISFEDDHVGQMIKMVSQTEKYYASGEVDADYNVTIDLAYEAIVKNGDHPNALFNKVHRVPIIKKRTISLDNKNKCLQKYHGNFDSSKQKCTYYLQVRRICIVVDLDSDTVGPAEDHEKYPCNYLTREPGFVMDAYMRWHSKESEPRAHDIDPERVGLHFYFKQAPEVMTMQTMDFLNFDFTSGNYRLESIIMMVLAVLSTIASLCLLSFRTDSFKSMTEEQKRELNRIEMQDTKYMQIKERRKQLEERRAKDKMKGTLEAQRREALRRFLNGDTNQLGG